MNPAQLTTEAPAPERQIEALSSLVMRKFLEAKQSDDLRRDIASKLPLSDGPFFLVTKFTILDRRQIKNQIRRFTWRKVDKRKVSFSRW